MHWFYLSRIYLITLNFRNKHSTIYIYYLLLVSSGGQKPLNNDRGYVIFSKSCKFCRMSRYWVLLKDEETILPVVCRMTYVLFVLLHIVVYYKTCLRVSWRVSYKRRTSWSWSHGSWIYMCNRCLSALKLCVRTPFMARCTRYNM